MSMCHPDILLASSSEVQIDSVQIYVRCSAMLKSVLSSTLRLLAWSRRLLDMPKMPSNAPLTITCMFSSLM